MPKTTNGSGSIVQLEKGKPKAKCRKWQLRVSTGLNPRTGKYVTRTRTVGGTFTDAQKALREFIADLEGDRAQRRTGLTLAEYGERFLEARAAKNEIAQTTLLSKGAMLRAAFRHLGGCKLENVTPAALNEMYVAMMRGDTISGRPASGSSVLMIHKNLSQLFRHAVNEGLLASNPCDRAEPPKMDTKAKKAIPPEKVRELVSALDPADPSECGCLLALTLGLRCGEVCGLSWKDVDFERDVLDVSHSYDHLRNLKRTKTSAGMRLLPLGEVPRRTLLAAKEAQLAQIERINAQKGPDEPRLEQTGETPVVLNRRGERTLPGALSSTWASRCKSFGLKGYTFHELRHTYLTMLALGGVHPKVMQELAGHASPQVTMEVYTHVAMEAKREAAEAFSKLF